MKKIFLGLLFILLSQSLQARYFDPEGGRFTSRDPLQYINGMNLYTGYFAQGFQMDPSGKLILWDVKEDSLENIWNQWGLYGITMTGRDIIQFKGQDKIPLSFFTVGKNRVWIALDSHISETPEEIKKVKELANAFVNRQNLNWGSITSVTYQSDFKRYVVSYKSFYNENLKVNYLRALFINEFDWGISEVPNL